MRRRSAVASSTRSSDVRALADGRPYTARQAHTSKLIDGVGYLSDTIDTMKLDLGLKEARVVTYTRPGGAYRGSIYAGSPAPQEINLVNIDMGALEGPAFMYIWPSY